MTFTITTDRTQPSVPPASGLIDAHAHHKRDATTDRIRPCGQPRHSPAATVTPTATGGYGQASRTVESTVGRGLEEPPKLARASATGAFTGR